LLLAKAGCFGAADAAELLEYCARLLDLYAARAAESLGVDVRAERALLGCWVLGAAMLLGSWVLGAADAAGWVGAAGAAEVRRYAGVLREAVGLLGIGYCAKLLSCCDADVLLEAVGSLNIGYA
jgi:hypothetical protein